MLGNYSGCRAGAGLVRFSKNSKKEDVSFITTEPLFRSSQEHVGSVGSLHGGEGSCPCPHPDLAAVGTLQQGSSTPQGEGLEGQRTVLSSISGHSFNSQPTVSNGQFHPGVQRRQGRAAASQLLL